MNGDARTNGDDHDQQGTAQRAPLSLHAKRLELESLRSLEASLGDLLGR